MREPLAILLGAGMTVATCLAAGLLLLDALRMRLARGEHALVAFLSGAASASLLVFLFCALHQARRGVFATAAIVLTGGALWQARKRAPGKALPELSKPYKWMFVIIFSAFTFLYFFNSMAPEVSPDGTSYHLDNVSHFWRAHGFDRTYDNMYYHLSQGLEMLFLMAYSQGKYSSAAMVHLAFLVALPLLIVCYARRFGMPKTGAFAAVLVYASPMVGIDGISAYNDVAVAAILFGVFYLLQVWDQEKDDKLLIIIGLLSGFCYAVKYTAGIGILFALGFVAWRKWVRVRQAEAPAPPIAGLVRALVLVAACAAMSVAPWMIKNLVWTGNPLAPMFNAWFPNPHVHISIEEGWREFLRSYHIPQTWQIPLQLTVLGNLVGGVLGPAFLLAPLALFALRHQAGRRLLAAAAVFAVPALLNTGARFLIPIVPYVALALGYVLERSPGVLPCIILFHGITSWPQLMTLYCHPHTWRLNGVPIEAALRLTPADKYISRWAIDYPLAAVMEKEVPQGVKVFSFAGMSLCYMPRDIMVSYTSAQANLLSDWLLCPITPASRPETRVEFRFAPKALRRVRVVQTGSGTAQWTVSEMRVFSAGRELPRAPQWRLRAHPNPWEVQLAFDNSYVTRWLSYQRCFPGMYLEVEFGQPTQVDSVSLECTAESSALPLKLEVMDDHAWAPVEGEPTRGAIQLPPGLRRAATRELQACGVGFVVARDGTDFAAKDMLRYAGYWGLTQIAEVYGARLYRIE